MSEREEGGKVKGERKGRNGVNERMFSHRMRVCFLIESKDVSLTLLS